ncbi:MAG: HepT-like ribonuclease domain-containing protein [Candidatus Omnitrophota bacterium]
MVKEGVGNYRKYIVDILEYITKITRYIKGISLEKLSGDERTIDVVVRNFEFIRDACGQLPKEVKDKYPEISWRDVINFRKIIIRNDENLEILDKDLGINLDIMWDIIENEFPPLERKIRKILINLPRE